MCAQFPQMELHIEGSILLYESVFDRHAIDARARDIVRQLELQHMAWYYDNNLEIVPAQCIGDQKPSVIRAFFVLLHLSEKGTMSIPEIIARMAVQGFHFSKAFVEELVQANNRQLSQGVVPAIWAVAFVLHRHSVGGWAGTPQYIAEELQKYRFEMSESVVKGIIKVQLERDLIKQQET